MNNRLQKFLDAENITQSQFADAVGVARASVSHILSGRNKPGFDFIESVSIHYPTLNIEWLINGKGRMYKNAPAPAPQENVGNDLFRKSLFSEEIEDDDESFEPQKSAELPREPVAEPASRPAVPKKAAVKAESAPRGERTVSKIIVFFSDGTFQEIG